MIREAKQFFRVAYYLEAVLFTKQILHLRQIIIIINIYIALFFEITLYTWITLNLSLVHPKSYALELRTTTIKLFVINIWILIVVSQSSAILNTIYVS